MTDFMNKESTRGESQRKGGLFGRTRQRRTEDGKGDGQLGWWPKKWKPLGAIQTTDPTFLSALGLLKTKRMAGAEHT